MKPAISRHLPKRILSLLMALVMIFSLIPGIRLVAEAETATKLYLKPNSNWESNNARFAAYFFGNGVTWVSMTRGDDVYEVTVPSGYPNVIFCRMDPATTENTWGNTWNQTVDLTVPTDGTTCYTVADGAWSKGGGTWSVYPPAETNPTEPPATQSYTATLHFVDSQKWGQVNLYAWIGDGAGDNLLNGTWPGNAVTRDDKGYYTATLNYEALENQDLYFTFSGSNKQTVNLSIPAAAFADGKAERWVKLSSATDGEGHYEAHVEATPVVIASPVIDGNSVTFYYKSDAASVKIAGDFTDWSGIDMTRDETTGIWSYTASGLSYGTHAYKFIVEGVAEWLPDPENTNRDSDGNSTFTLVNPNLDENRITIKIHYTRTDGDYTGWNIFGWDAPIDEQPVFDEDHVATISFIGRAVQKFTFKVRKSTQLNDWAEQSGEYSVDLSNVLSGTVHLYLKDTEKEGIGTRTYENWITGNKISDVQLDYQNNAIAITTSQPVKDSAAAFSLVKRKSGQTVDMTYDSTTGTYIPAVTLALDTLYEYKIRFNEDPTEAYQIINYPISYENAYVTERFVEEFTYTGDDLGVTLRENATAFRLWAPTATAVSVNLYESGTADTNDLIEWHVMTPSANGTWVAEVSEKLNGKYYTYSVTVDGETVEVVDPYARSAGVNGQRGMILDLDTTDPEGWDEDTNPNPITSYTDAIIYELHVRDFSIDETSGAVNKGKFLAFTEEGTTVPGTDISTGIDYLASMGFTHLHLLPIYDYASVDETTCDTFNWGYDPQNYNVPEGSYSTDPYHGEVRVSEMKQMVKALHDNGISVIMDVVYNHVYNAETFSFNQIVPDYFSRIDSNASGCGNDTASERAMVRKYIVESVLYWCEEYHIDGFRFDLVGLLDVETINQIVEEVHAIRPDVIFYGEGWNMDGTNQYPDDLPMAKQGNAYLTPGFAYFSDSMRNSLAGNNGQSTAFVSGNGSENAISDNFQAKPVTDNSTWTTDPQQVIQYASCHDNYTLIDKLVVALGAEEMTKDIQKMSNLAAAIYMTSQGVPFIHAGEEFFREKLEEDGSRCENSYNASDSVNKIVWSRLEDYGDNSDWYKGLIDFRQAHPALRLSTAEAVASRVKWVQSSNNLVIFQIDGSGLENEASSIYLIFNGKSEAQVVSLPAGDWEVCIDSANAGTESLRTVSNTVAVAAYSPLILVQEEAPATETRVALVGSFNDWNTSNYLTQSPEDASVYTATIGLTASTYEFKVMVDGVWLGNAGTIDNETQVGWTMDAESNCKLTADGGIYTFTFDTDTNQLTVDEDETITAREDKSGIQDGVTLHCWNWSFAEIETNMATIAAQGYTAIQTSPVQPMKEPTTQDQNPTATVAKNWWVFYQPVDFAINTASGNALGTQAELESMIAAADAYGIQVIVDVVSNHLGNKTGNDLAELIPNALQASELWHDLTANTANYGSRYQVTQLCMGGLPDLNTANETLQGYVIAFLKDCIDLGVDGFRFDATKHIETPYDMPGFASDFWPNIITAADAYAAEKGQELYLYGEILDSIWPLPAIAYTQYMSVTDNVWGNTVRHNVVDGKAELTSVYNMAANASVGAEAGSLVIWAESHDTYATDNEWEISRTVSDANILKTWALVAARADAMPLYFARPDSFTQPLGVASVNDWASDTVAKINKFHNAFNGESEYIANENGISYVERGTSGVILVNVSGSNEVSVTANQMADGTYTDQLTGNTFTVADGKITGTIGDTGIAVVTAVPLFDDSTLVPDGWQPVLDALSPEELEKLKESSFITAPELGAAGLMEKVAMVSSMASDLIPDSQVFYDLVASEPFMRNMATALGYEPDDAAFNDKMQELLERKMNTVEEPRATYEILSNNAVLTACANTNKTVQEMMEIVLAGFPSIRETLEDTTGEGLANAAAAYAMYTAYAYNYANDAERETAIQNTLSFSEARNAINNDEAFKTYMATEDAYRDMTGYLAAMNMVTSSIAASVTAVESVLVNGFDNVDLITVLEMALSDESVPTGPVAQIGDTTYLSLQDALNAVETNGTITLLANVTDAVTPKVLCTIVKNGFTATIDDTAAMKVAETTEQYQVISNPIFGEPSKTLNYGNIISLVAIYSIENTHQIDLTKDAGLLVWMDAAPAEVAYDAAYAFPGLTAQDGKYIGMNNGIPNNTLGSTLYFCAYVRLEDGSYAYSSVTEYSVAAYVKSQIQEFMETIQSVHQDLLENKIDQPKYSNPLLQFGVTPEAEGIQTYKHENTQLSIAALNFTSGTQQYFQNITNNTLLANYALNASYPNNTALVDALKDVDAQYTDLIQDASGLTQDVTVAEDKQVGWDQNVFTRRAKTVRFDTNISLISVYGIPSQYIPRSSLNNKSKAGVIFWTEEQFNAISGTPSYENRGDGTVKPLLKYSNGLYSAESFDINPKDMQDTKLYIMAYVIKDGVEYHSGVEVYSIEQYISNIVGKSTTAPAMKYLAQSLLVYERSAKLALLKEN